MQIPTKNGLTDTLGVSILASLNQNIHMNDDNGM